ncbi:MAG: preprotein translocase subunit SecE [Candidatus Lernaella stagnicola]|nr:preprotein translocase subunit SecE [Candidatus Lernaella stagnicola]
MLNKIKIFLREVRAELRKVSWPSREVTIASTWVVIAICFIFAVYFAVVDYSLGWLIKAFLGAN